MEHFKQHRRGQRQAMDGIINAPSRPQLSARPLDAVSGDSLRSTARKIGDFKKREGYHVANSSMASTRRAHDMQKQQVAVSDEPALLNMTLPGKKEHHRRGEKAPGKKRDLRKIRKYVLRGGLIFLMLILLVGGFLFAKGYLKLHKVFKGGGSAAALKSEVEPSLLKGEGDGRVNILLLGRGGEGHEGADLTDTILVASIDPVNKKAALVSLPRDFWVTTAYGSSKVNAVFANAKQRALVRNKDVKAAEKAGVDAVEKEVTEILGLNIHYYSIVDFQAFKQAVDTVGGVDITITDATAVTERLWDETTRKNYFLNVTPGMQHFDGQKALFFARSRHTSVRGDFDRAERQRVFIQSLAQKVTSAKTYTNPVKVSQLMDAFGDHVATDLSLDDAMRLLSIGKGIGGNFESIDLADRNKPLVRTGMINGQSVVMPSSVDGGYSDIQALVRGKLRDGYLARENANVTVLNGTETPGLAGQKADQLKSYGYNVGTVADAPTQSYQNTVIVDLTKGKKPYTKNYLEKRFSRKVTTTLPDQAIQPGTADFVIILGHNETINR